MCAHLIPLEKGLLEAGFKITFQGQAWTNAAGEWTYFNCYLDLDKLRKIFKLADFVQVHEHLGTHDGSELGFYCQKCGDAIMGIHPQVKTDHRSYP